MIRSVGIIGLGSFGSFAASLVPQDVEVISYYPATVRSSIPTAPLSTVMQSDVVLLAVPLSAYPDLLVQIKPQLKPDTLLIDICSVKLKPNELLEAHMSDHPNLLVTHPLFGPETAAAGQTKGRDLIVTKSLGEKAGQVLDFCKNTLELSIHHMTPETHDQTMAQIHALTFFVARGLANMHIQKIPFQTPSFQMILNLIEFDSKHSDQLFQTIQQGNPYAATVREQVVKNFETLAIDLEKA
jgi:prephenate dehydrogenase